MEAIDDIILEASLIGLIADTASPDRDSFCDTDSEA